MLKVKINTKFRVLMVASLAFLLTLMTIFIMKTKGISMYGDTQFHAGRIYDIREAFKSHHIPMWVNFSSFYGMGQAVNGMYPDITLWPLVLLTNYLNFENQLIAIKVIILILTFVVTYLSLVKHQIGKENAFYVSILYTFSGYSLYQFLYELQPGAIIIYIFTFPLIFSIKEVLYEKSLDKRLVLKLSVLFGIVLYSHILTAVVIGIVIIILWILRILLEKELNYSTILNLFYASLLTIIYALPILYRMLVISDSQIATPSGPSGKGKVLSVNLIDIFSNPQVSTRWTLSFVALFLLIISFHYFNKKVSRMLLAEMVLLILSSNIVPWNILDNLPIINMLQYAPWRFGIYLSAPPMLAFLYTHIKNKNIILFLLTLVTLMAIPEAERSIIHTSNLNDSRSNFGSITRDYLPAKTIGDLIENKVPKSVQEKAEQPVIENSHRSSMVKKDITKYGTITLNNRKFLEKGTYTIPVYYYPSLYYRIQINGRVENQVSQDKHGYMKLKLSAPLPQNSKIKVSYSNPIVYDILLIISLTFYLSVFIYLVVKDIQTMKSNAVKIV